MAKQNLKFSDKTADALCALITTMLDHAQDEKWTKPWLCRSRGLAPMNKDSKKAYRGINAFLLDLAISMNGYKTPFFMTLDQVNKLGLRLKRKVVTITNADGTTEQKEVAEGFYPVFKWIVRIVDADGNEIKGEEYDELTEEEQDECTKFFTLKTYCEYNLDQTTMDTEMPELYEKYVAIANDNTTIVEQEEDAIDSTLDYILTTPGAWRCPITFDGGDTAYYMPATDSIHLPLPTNFYKKSDVYSTALHEMAHSTKAEPHMKRKYKGTKQEQYATEELVAELTSAIVSHDLGLEKTIANDHLVYVNGWKSAIKDKDVLPRIINDIMACVTYEMNHYNRVKNLLECKAA